MSHEEFDYLYDTTEQTSTRFVSFIGRSIKRFDLSITVTNRFYGKLLVTDLQMGKTAIIGGDDLDEEGYLEHLFQLTEEEALELNDFLSHLVSPSTFTDF